MISIDKLSTLQGGFRLRNIDLELPQRSYGILMGPTGCGKTTLIESICGLRKIQSGRVFLNGKDVTRIPAARRGIGFVPQDAGLFPAMRVDRQIEFALEVRKIGKHERSRRTAELAALLQIESLLKRYPHGLSGGEKQRVALARALSFRPALLCLDEPLSALDESTRSQMVDLLKAVFETELVTVLHITHSESEGRRLGTHHFQFADGQLNQFNNPGKGEDS